MNQAQRKIFDEHREWAEGIARDYFARNGPMNGNDLEDYKQWALMGMLAVIGRWRPLLGTFKAWAYKRVHGAIVQGLRDTDEVGRSQRARGKRGPIVSLDHGRTDDAGRVMLLREALQSPRTADRSAAFDQIAQLLFGLHALDRTALYMSLAHEMDAGQIAAVMGLDEPRVVEMLETALAYLARNHTELLPRVREIAEQLGLFAGLETGLFAAAIAAQSAPMDGAQKGANDGDTE